MQTYVATRASGGSGPTGPVTCRRPPDRGSSRRARGWTCSGPPKKGSSSGLPWVQGRVPRGARVREGTPGGRLTGRFPSTSQRLSLAEGLEVLAETRSARACPTLLAPADLILRCFTADAPTTATPERSRSANHRPGPDHSRRGPGIECGRPFPPQAGPARARTPTHRLGASGSGSVDPARRLHGRDSAPTAVAAGRCVRAGYPPYRPEHYERSPGASRAGSGRSTPRGSCVRPGTRARNQLRPCRTAEPGA